MISPLNIEGTELDLLGYQLRLPLDALAQLWPFQRRQHFLLNVSVLTPLAADVSVWPIYSGSRLTGELFDDFDPSPNSAPNALNLFSLRTNVPSTRANVSDEEGVLVALTTKKNWAAFLRNKNFVRDRMVIDPQLRFAGFDVCDERFCSGLSNCGVGIEVQRRLRDSYEAALNRFGLFEDLAIAESYSSEIGKVVPEHAPFEIVGLYIRT